VLRHFLVLQRCKGSKKNEIGEEIIILCPSHFLPQPIRVQLHPTKREPFLAQVLQQGPDTIGGIVDAFLLSNRSFDQLRICSTDSTDFGLSQTLPKQQPHSSLAFPIE
jgi:hypothetical protein